MAVAAVLAAGCDLRDPLAPVPAPTPDQVPRALVDPVGEFSSTGFLSVPGTSTQSTGSVGPTPIGGAMPRDMWVRVRTSGTVSYTINPDARDIPCGMQCVDHAPRFGEGEAGGAGIPGNFALRTYLTFASGYEPSPRNLGNQLEWVVRVKAGAVLRARRSGIPGGPSCPACDPPAPYVGWYLLSGGTVVTVEEVIPLQAAPRQLEVVRGDSVTFDAVAIDGTTNLRWYFGDIGGAARVSACDGKTTCTIAPRRNGFMYIYGDYDGQSIFSARSETVRLVNAKLTLDCSPNPVVRGQKIDCTAKADPESATLTEIKWNFTDSVGNQVPGPDGAFQWGGTIVISGKMHLSARVNGHLLTADSAITVMPRIWAALRLDVAEQNPNHLPAPGAITFPHHLGHSHVDTLASYPAETVGDGPNAGWTYLRDELPPFPFTVHINEPAFAPGSAWYNLQVGGTYIDPSTGVLVPNGYCRKPDVATLRQLVREHEGSVPSALTSHAEVARRFVRRNRLQDAAESLLVHRSEVPEVSRLALVQARIDEYVVTPIMGDPDQFHTNDPVTPGLVQPATFPCYPRPFF